MILVIELPNGSRAPSADVCRIRPRRRGEMRSMRRAARSRAAGYNLATVRELLIPALIYLGPSMVCAAPLLFLCWVYRPTILTNPGLSDLKEPFAMIIAAARKSAGIT